MVPEGIWKWAQMKGITVVGTGDFTHPKWFKELGEKLEPTGNGLFQLKEELQPESVPESCRADLFFLLSVEISCIYKKHDRNAQGPLSRLCPRLCQRGEVQPCALQDRQYKIGRKAHPRARRERASQNNARYVCPGDVHPGSRVDPAFFGVRRSIRFRFTRKNASRSLPRTYMP